MAQETIALTITLNGQERVVTSLQDLARVIRTSQSEIAILKEKGDDTWRSYQQELDKVINRYEDLKKSVRGTNFDRQIDQFVRFGNLITQVFAAATSANSLFGGDSEEAAKRQAQAQEVLAIAFTVAQVAKEKDTIKTIANTVANIANTAATKGLTAATRQLYTVLKANPWVLIATGVAAAAVALFEYADANKEANEAEKERQKRVEDSNKTIQDQRKSLQTLVDQFDGYLRLLETGKITQEQYEVTLKNLVPGFNDLNLSISENEKSLRLYAQAQINLQQVTTELQEAQKNYQDLVTEGNVAGALSQGQEIDRLLKRKAVLETEVKTRRESLEAIIQADKDSAKSAQEAAEARKKAILDQLALESRLRKELIEVLEIQQKLGEVEVEFQTQAQVEYYKQLSTVTEEYLTVAEKLTELNRDLYEEDVKLITDAQNELTNAGKKVTNTIKLIEMGFAKAGTTLQQTDLAGLLKTALDIEEGADLSVERQINNRIKLLNFEKQFIDDYVKNQVKNTTLRGEELAAFTKNLEEEGALLFETLVKNQQELTTYGKSVDDAEKKLQKLTETSRSLRKEQDVQSGFLRQNQKDILDQYNVYFDDVAFGENQLAKLRETIRTKDFDFQRDFLADILNLQFQLREQGFDISKAGYEEQLILLEQFLLKMKKMRESEKPLFDWKQIKKDLLTGIQEVQGALNGYAQLTSQYYQNQLDALDAQNEKIQAKIVGDTEEANQKRLEADQIYQERRKEIEKRAAKTALQISLAQAIANAAASIVKITEQTGVLAPIAATIAAGINVAQIAQIRAQISALDSYQKGGFIKGMGGLVVGPSHEYGGVKYAQGGVELEGGEAVINRVSSVRYAPLLSEINQAGGGKPLVVNNFDDSRIVEAIAKQKSEPLRAYVLEQDITEKQQVQARLEQLSQI